MAHNFGRSLFGIVGTSKMIAARPSDRSAIRSVSMVLLAIVSAALVCLPALAQTPSPYVPAMIASSNSPVPTTLYVVTTATPLTGTQTNLIKPDEVVLDPCGNIYAFDRGDAYGGNWRVTEINPAGGPASIAYIKGNAWAVRLGIDETHQNLILGHDWSPYVHLIPIGGCAPQPTLETHAGGSGNGTDNWYNPGHVVGDFQGNTFIAVDCCDGSYSLYKVIKDTSFPLLSKLPKEIMTIAVDKLENAFFVMDGAVYELPYDPIAAKYAKVPVPYGKYINPVGVSMDWVGNLYVSDSSAGIIYEVPYEAAGLNLADQFIVSGGIIVNTAVAVNARGDMYYTASGAAFVTGLTVGHANFYAVAVGQTANVIMNFQFNAASTITNIQLPAGDFSIQPPALGTTACTTPTTYGPGAPRMNCQVTVGFKPSSVGKQSSAILITYTTAGVDAKGNPTTNTVTASAFLQGIGQGALVTFDPGIVTPAGSGLKSPAGVAIDQAGDTFVADPGNNAVLEFPVGGGAAVPVAIVAGTTSKPLGVTPPLAAPGGVAVDGAGNVFIADTGNNRLVEVPFVNGALSPAAATIVAGGLKAPASVYAHTNGDLYVADTGDNTILVYPAYPGASNTGVVFGPPAKLGDGLLGPLAVTVDGPGNVFIADSGNNQILEYPLGAGQEIVAANILHPSGLATDTSGSLFVVDQGNFRVLRIPSVQGILSPNSAAEVGLGIANPYAIAVDASSNLYVTDMVNGQPYTIARSQGGLGFGNLAVGVASTALPLTVESAGNLPLVFSAPYFTETGNAGDFALTSPTGACADGLTLPAGTNCDLATTFTPTVAGSRSATILLTSNAANTPQITLTGAGVSPSPTTTTVLLIPSAPGAPFYGEPLSVTATIAATTGTGTPTGVVAFIVDGTQIALLPVLKGVATLPLNSGLTGGPHTLSAIYKGDSSNNGSSSSLMSFVVAKAPTTPLLIITQIPYNNPYSLRHSNTGSCDVNDGVGNTITFFSVGNDGIKFQASVTSPGVGVPSGTLTFYSDGKLINGTADPVTGLDPLTPGLKPATSVTPLLPFTGGTFLGYMSTDANTLELHGNAPALGENNISVGPHNITVVYSGDQNYLPSTSNVAVVTVTDISPIVNFTGTTANNSTSVTAVSATTGLVVGQFVTGIGVTDGTTIAAIGSDTITLSAVATGSGVADSLTASLTPRLLPMLTLGPSPHCLATQSSTNPLGARPSAPGTFTVAASSTNLTVSAATPATTVLTISSLGGWHGVVDVSCPDLPQYTTCSTNPGQATINPSNVGQTLLPSRQVLTITTNVPSYVPSAAQGGFFWMTSVFLGLLMIAGRRRFRQATAGLSILGFALLLFGGIAGLSGCGSSSSPNSSVVTKPGTYQVHVVFTGAQYETTTGGGGTVWKYISRADLPYSVAFTLNVK